MARQKKIELLLRLTMFCVLSYKASEALEGTNRHKQEDAGSNYRPHEQEKYLRESQIDFQRHNKEIRIVVVGKTGVGKSSTINTIAGKKLFNVSASSKSVTKHCDFARFAVEGKPILIVDTPWLFDTDTSHMETIQELAKVMTITAPGFHVFFIVIKMGNRFTEEEYNSILMLRKMFGPELYERSVIVFTGLDTLEHDGDTFENYVASASGNLAKLIEECDRRIVPFNTRLLGANNEDARKKQNKLLMKTIETILKSKQNSYYTNEIYEEIQDEIDKEIKRQRADKEAKRQEEEQIRIVVVGKTGVGKSSTINTIAGKKLFNVSASSKSVTKHCDFARFEIEGKPVLIVDTPGLFDTDTSHMETIQELAKVMTITAPGFHVFFIVIKMGNRFTEEEYNSILMLRKMFGPELYERSVIVFTGLDTLEHDGDTFENYVASASENLAKLIEECDRRIVPFNTRLLGANNEDARKKQNKLLMKTIETILKSKQNSYYTNEIYEEIQDEIDKEIKRRRAEKEAKRQEEERKERERKKLREDLEQEKMKRKAAEEDKEQERARFANEQRKRREAEEDFDRERRRRRDSEEREREREYQRERDRINRKVTRDSSSSGFFNTIVRVVSWFFSKLFGW